MVHDDPAGGVEKVPLILPKGKVVAGGHDKVSATRACRALPEVHVGVHSFAGLLVLENNWVCIDIDFIFCVTMVADEIRLVAEDGRRV